MNDVNVNTVQEKFARILIGLGKMEAFFTVSDALSRDGAEELTAQVMRLLDDQELMALLPHLTGEAELAQAVKFLAANAGVARFLADEQAQMIVKGMANDGLYQIAQKLASLPDDDPLIGRLVDDQTPFLATLQVLAAHPEMDAMLSAILRLLANDPASHVLPDDEDFARLVIDLAESQAALDPARRGQLYELVKGFAMEPESQDLARKILFTSRFPRVAARLADDDELIKVVRRMQDDEQHKKVAEMLKAGGDSAQVILSVAEDPEFAETITRMCEDKAHPNGFNELLKKLRNNDNQFFDQVKTLSDDEQLKGIHDALVQRPLNATTIANRLSDLGERLHNEGTDEEAITTYMLAIRLDPGLKKAYQGHAQACLAKGYYTQCVEDYKTLIKKDKLDTNAHLKLGQVDLLMGLLKEAEECFRKVLELSTDTEERQQADDGLADIARKENL